MPTTRTFTLPPRDQMFRKLVAVLDNDHAIQKLYPMLLNFAGRQLDAKGIAVRLNSAAIQYSSGMSALAWIELQPYLRQFVNVLVDDDDIRNEILDNYFQDEVPGAASNTLGQPNTSLPITHLVANWHDIPVDASHLDELLLVGDQMVAWLEKLRGVSLGLAQPAGEAISQWTRVRESSQLYQIRGAGDEVASALETASGALVSLS